MEFRDQVCKWVRILKASGRNHEILINLDGVRESGSRTEEGYPAEILFTYFEIRSGISEPSRKSPPKMPSYPPPPPPPTQGNKNVLFDSNVVNVSREYKATELFICTLKKKKNICIYYTLSVYSFYSVFCPASSVFLIKRTNPASTLFIGSASDCKLNFVSQVQIEKSHVVNLVCLNKKASFKFG